MTDLDTYFISIFLSVVNTFHQRQSTLSSKFMKKEYHM